MQSNQAVAWLYGFESQRIKLGLERISRLMEGLGNPQEAFVVLHVGGTNGKGSVCHFLSSILTKGGYRVGTYLSPHIQHLEERFMIDGKCISSDELNRVIERVKPVVDDMMQQGMTPTFFEVCTALAFVYFKEQHVEYAVVEVGLGGRFDATNIVSPLVSIITNVTRDHHAILGDSVEKIAQEKAGIIKPGIPMITAATDSSLKVIKEIAYHQKAPVYDLSRDQWKRIEGDGFKQMFFFQGRLQDYYVQTSMIGRHQGENIALALSAVEELQMQGLYLTEQSILEGIQEMKNPGRMEIVGRNPLVILDGAHNIAGMQQLVETLLEDFTYKRLIFILGILSDKDIQQMLLLLLPWADVILSTKSESPRAYDSVKLDEMISDLNYQRIHMVTDTVEEAVHKAREIAGPKDLICVTGSLFTVGEARTALGLTTC
jgi:dihydrofolate synthase/folylpolyglutamate synthase